MCQCPTLDENFTYLHDTFKKIYIYYLDKNFSRKIGLNLKTNKKLKTTTHNI